MKIRDSRIFLAIRLILATMFVVSGVLKSLDALGFGVTLGRDYGFPVAVIVPAMFLPTFEVGLGVSMLLWTPTRRSYTASLVLLGVFSLAIVAGTLTGNLESCGCFGPALDSSPGTALARNAALIGLATYARFCAPVDELRTVQWRHHVRTTCMVVVMGLTVHSNRMPLIDSGPKLGTVMEGDLHDLPFASDGLSLLYIFHPGCSHCWNNVPRVETFANNGINVIGVMPSGIEANILDEFRTQVAPDFPYQELPMTEIDKLVPHGYPAALLIEDGRIVQKFRGDAIPSYPTFLKQK